MNGNGMMRLVIWEFNRFFFSWREISHMAPTHMHTLYIYTHTHTSIKPYSKSYKDILYL